MKGGHGTVPPHAGPLETITVVAQCDLEDEEELVTITAEATPPPPQGHGCVVVEAVPGILVTDITSASVCGGGSPPCVSELRTKDRNSGLAHRSTTTTTSPCGAVPAPPQLPQPQDTPPTHPTVRRGAVVAPPTTVRGARRVGGSTQGVGHQAPDVVPLVALAQRGVKATPLAPAAAPQALQGGGGGTPTLCSFCRGGVGVGDALSSLHLLSPLPHSLLSVPTLLQALGVPPPTTSTTGQATLCQECRALLQEGDEAYQCLLAVTSGMRRRWAAVPLGSAVGATARGGRRVRPILPKPAAALEAAVACALCRAVPGDWRTHAALHHRLSARWRSARLLTALRACVAEELRHGSGSQGEFQCPACPRTWPWREDFVAHLREHHRLAPDHSLLAPVGRAVGQRQGQGQAMPGWRRGAGEAAGLVQGRVEAAQDEPRTTVCEEVLLVREEQEKESVQKRQPPMDKGEAKDAVKAREEEQEGEEEEECCEGMREESVVGVNVVEEHVEAARDSVEVPQEAGHSQSVCPREPRGGVGPGPGPGPGQGRGRGSQWRCRVCAATFTSQQDHDLHKAAAHPGSVRAGRGSTRPAPPPSPSQAGAAAAGDGLSQGCLTAAPQEGAIVIMEGDGCGGVTHRRLQPPDGAVPQPGGDAGLLCGACGEVFGDRPALVRHRRAAHPGAAGGGGSEVLVECPLCGRRVSGLPALRLHQARVHGRTSQLPQHSRCRLCLAQCHTRAQLERHMRERHGAPPPPPPVRCEQCGKTYSARYIDVHVANMHGDAGRFPCTFCPMRFGVRAGLRAHVSLEHANTAWSCQECSLQFAKYHQLRQHRLYVHSRAEHRCPECPRSFKRRCDLTEHAKRRHRQRPPRECSFCPKVYSDRKRLRMHLMRKHGVAWEDTLARGYACRQRENNCLRRRQQQQAPRSPRLPLRQQQAAAAAAAGVAGEAVAVLGEEDQPEYSVVELTEAAHHPLTDTISYIILEEA